MANHPDEDQIQGTSSGRENRKAGLSHSGGTLFEIHVKGHLNPSWSEWLENLELECLENGEMILSGRLADQAALLGVLNKLNRLNLAILSVSEAGRK
jgi:hypothetical protein